MSVNVLGSFFMVTKLLSNSMDDFLAFSRTGYQDSGTWAFILLQNPPSLPEVTVTASLLHSLHKCSASLREHGPQKASREVSSALTNEYDQNHVKLSDPLAELGRPAHSSPSHCILPRAALFGTFIEHLVHLFRDEGKTLYASLIISANHYWTFSPVGGIFFFSMITFRSQVPQSMTC